MKRKNTKGISILLTVILLMSVFVTPVAAGQENGRERRNVPAPEIQHLDAEVRVIAGQPVITVETKRGYVDIPVALPEVFLVDGQTIPLQLQGNGVVVPTRDGPVVVPLEELDMVVANGQVMLVGQVNAIFTFALAILSVKYGETTFGGKRAAAFVGVVAGAVVDNWILSRI